MSDSQDSVFDELALAVAHGLARKHGLERDGTVWCWECGSRPALMPQLHCPPCLADAWRRNGSAMACPSREQTPADVEACRNA